MRFIILLSLLLCLCQNSNSQNNEVDIVPIKFHVITSGNSFYNETVVAQQIDTLNVKFSEADIEFQQCEEINFIQSAEFADGWDPFTIINNMHDLHSLPNVINVFVANTTEVFNGYSFSGPQGIWGYSEQENALVISGIESLSNDPMLLAHEMGHYFGLYHTASEPGNSELVDGSNCTTAGDYCCDTPAEYGGMCCPIVDEMGNCSYTTQFGEVLDSQGDVLFPDVTNIMCTMSFTMGCRHRFSEDQYTRIRFYHDNFLNTLSCNGVVPSTDELISEADLTLYPNPSQDSFRLPFSDQIIGVELFGALGNAIGHEQSQNNSDLVITPTSTTKGLIMVHIELSNRVLVRKVLMH